MPALLARDGEALAEAIERSCQNKAEVVADDEREAGKRALLNPSATTFGHAIETGMDYGAGLHGEAVSAGMGLAADLSHRLGLLATDDLARARALIAAAGLPVAPPPELTPQVFRDLMAVDRKGPGRSPAPGPSPRHRHQPGHRRF